MNDTKVQRYTPDVMRKQVATGVSYGLAEMVVREHGAYILYADHTRLVAEKDARLLELWDVQAITTNKLDEAHEQIASLTALLTKYQRLHASDVALDRCLDHAVIDDQAYDERKAAIEALA